MTVDRTRWRQPRLLLLPRELSGQRTLRISKVPYRGHRQMAPSRPRNDRWCNISRSAYQRRARIVCDIRTFERFSSRSRNQPGDYWAKFLKTKRFQ